MLQPAKVRMQTLAVVGIATLGEIVGSLCGSTRYRLENLPAFVPPAHGLVYLAGLSLATLAARVTALLVAAGAVALTWGIAGVTVLPAPDVAGTIGCAFLIGVLVWTRRPVYAGVFMVVVGLEPTAPRWAPGRGADRARPRSVAGEPTERRRERLRRLRRARLALVARLAASPPRRFSREDGGDPTRRRPCPRG